MRDPQEQVGIYIFFMILAVVVSVVVLVWFSTTLNAISRRLRIIVETLEEITSITRKTHRQLAKHRPGAQKPGSPRERPQKG
jgi:hypothetical protein